MAVYVDQVTTYPSTMVRGRARRCGLRWSHMWADTLDELHAMAEAVGMRREWFQDKRFPHYDLVPRRREHAVRLGAVEVSSRELLRRMREKRDG